MLYGGVYRSPPAPKQRRPSAILPSEVFPNPPLGARIRQIVMAVVAAQWIIIPPSQQRRPVVIEEQLLPQSQLIQHQTILSRWHADPQPPQQRIPTVTAGTPVFLAPRIDSTNNRLIVASWRHITVPQRFHPTAILPTEVFPDPPIENRRRIALEIVAAAWLPVPQLQQRRPTVIEEIVPGIVSQLRIQDRLIIASWETVPSPQRSRPSAILPVEVFPDPPLGVQGHQYEQIIAELWETVPAPQQRPSRAILPAEVFPDPPLGAQGRQYERVVLESWYKAPQPQQRPPYVTETGPVTTTKNFFGAIISDTVYVSESSINPTTSDDVSVGYRTGSIWLNSSAGTIFMCLDPTNPAVWKQVSN